MIWSLAFQALAYLLVLVAVIRGPDAPVTAIRCLLVVIALCALRIAFPSKSTP